MTVLQKSIGYKKQQRYPLTFFLNLRNNNQGELYSSNDTKRMEFADFGEMLLEINRRCKHPEETKRTLQYELNDPSTVTEWQQNVLSETITVRVIAQEYNSIQGVLTRKQRQICFRSELELLNLLSEIQDKHTKKCSKD